MYFHTTASTKGPDCHAIVLRAYMQLAKTMRIKYPDAAAMKYVDYVTLAKLKKLEGKQIYKQGQIVKTKLIKHMLSLWNAELGPTGCFPSGKSWDWVRKRVLIKLWRRCQKNIIHYLKIQVKNLLSIYIVSS